MKTFDDKSYGLGIITGISGTLFVVSLGLSGYNSMRAKEQTEYCAAVMAGATPDIKELCPTGSYRIYFDTPVDAGDLSRSCGKNLENCK